MPKIGDIIQGKRLGHVSGNLYIWLACQKCREERWVNLSRTKQKNYQGLCRSCSSSERATNQNMQGANNPQWRGGYSKDKNGYAVIWISPDNPYYSMVAKRRKGNHIFEHRLVMAKHLGRCLQSWEIVHHKNGIKDDNRIENLYLVNRSTHEHRTIEKYLKKEVTKLQDKLEEQAKQIKLLKWQIKQLNSHNISDTMTIFYEDGYKR